MKKFDPKRNSPAIVVKYRTIKKWTWKNPLSLSRMLEHLGAEKFATTFTCERNCWQKHENETKLTLCVVFCSDSSSSNFPSNWCLLAALAWPEAQDLCLKV
jgi:hypothetical protein